MPDVIEQFKRLEAIGVLHRESTTELLTAAADLSASIISKIRLLGKDTVFPLQFNFGVNHYTIERDGVYLTGRLVYVTRTVCLHWCDDLQRGWLDRLNTEIQKG